MSGGRAGRSGGTEAVPGSGSPALQVAQHAVLNALRAQRVKENHDPEKMDWKVLLQKRK
jgi:hypothetical protein